MKKMEEMGWRQHACNVEIGEEIGGMRRDWGEIDGMRTDRQSGMKKMEEMGWRQGHVM